jgi:hypothetical protein
VGRFISRDGFPGHDLVTQTRNRYAYAGNNPVIHSDPDGQIWNFVVGFGIGVVEYTATHALENALQGKPLLQDWDAGDAIISGAQGAITYGIPGLGPAARILTAAAGETAKSTYHQVWDNPDHHVDLLQTARDGVIGGVLEAGATRLLPSVPGTRGAMPKRWLTAFTGQHARNAFKLLPEHVLRGFLTDATHDMLFPSAAYAAELNGINGSYDVGTYINAQPGSGPARLGAPSRQK